MSALRKNFKRKNLGKIKEQWKEKGEEACLRTKSRFRRLEIRPVCSSLIQTIFSLLVFIAGQKIVKALKH
jgi:hypothetical protein